MLVIAVIQRPQIFRIIVGKDSKARKFRNKRSSLRSRSRDKKKKRGSRKDSLKNRSKKKKTIKIFRDSFN